MKKFLKTFIIFIILLMYFSIAKVYSTWYKNYGGANADQANSIQQTSDGGYIVAGFSQSYTYGGKDFAIYKLDSSGNKVWFKHYGGANDDEGKSIQQTSDGGYIVAGWTQSYTYGFHDFAIFKLDSSGNKTWFKHYGGTSSDLGYCIEQTSEGGYVVTGNTRSYTHGSSDFAIYKLDSNGNKIWFKHYGGASGDYGYSIQQTTDGGYIVAGYCSSYTYGGEDFAIYRLNSSGNKVWFKHYGGGLNDYAQSIQQISDGGYVVAGYTHSYTYGNSDYAIYKLNSSGNNVWFKHYGGLSYDTARLIQQTSDGGYIVAGNAQSYSYGSYDFALYKLNSSGNKTWFKHYGSNTDDGARSIQQTSDGGYIMAGYTDSCTYGGYDFAIYKLDNSGN